MSGEVTQLDGAWLAVTAMTGDGDALYLTSERALYRVDARGHEVLGDDAWEARFLVGVGGALISIEPDGAMYRIDPADASWRKLDGDWSSAIAATACDGKLFVIERSGSLYQVDAATGAYTEVDTGYEHTVWFAGARGALCSIDDSGALYRGATRLPETWTGVTGMVGDAGGLYLATRDAIHAVDPATGAGAELVEIPWRAPRLAAAAGALYVHAQPDALYRVDL